jgi:hypothetical protein
MSKTTENSVVLPKITKRNELGLLEGVEYVYTDDGRRVNWRKMIKPEFLVPNKQYFKNVPVPETIEGLEDNKLLILLGGIKELARFRGYQSVVPTVTSSSENRVEATCLITWVPNFEEGGIVQSFGDGADATPDNTGGFGKNYLTAIAINRAFVRAVRNYLGINIVSQEEIGGADFKVDANEDMDTTLLKDIMIQYGISFEKVKAKLIEEKLEGAENFTSINQIPRFKKFELIERIKQKAKEQGKA